MRRDLLTSLIAVVLMTVLFGLAYPLAFTGVAQVLFPGKAERHRRSTVNGKVVGSSLIGQEFTKNGKPDRRYFQRRPSATGYNADVTFFSNLGPNSRTRADRSRRSLADLPGARAAATTRA